MPVLLTPLRRGAMGDGIPDVLQCTTSPFSSSFVKVGTLSKFLDKWRSITFNRFVLNMVKGHHLQLRSCPPLFHNFKWFNMKAATTHHAIIQKEVDELLVKEAVGPKSVVAGFFSIVFIVPKHTGGLDHIYP